METYDASRPSAEQACRLGDERVLNNPDLAFDPKPVDFGNRPVRVKVNIRSSRPLASLQAHPLIAGIFKHVGRGLFARLVARLIEVALIPQRLLKPRPLTVQRSSMPGLSRFEVARGRLVHRILLDGDRICRYRILAPTGWNFHPHGVATEALESISEPRSEDSERLANLLIHAIDPGVGYQLSWEPA